MIRVLDLFSGAGGASQGYQDAGAVVIAVDNDEDALAHNQAIRCRMDWLVGLKWFGDQVDLIHASPPCQGYTTGHYGHHKDKPTPGKAGSAPRLIGQVRAALLATGKPFVIENVPGSETPKWGEDRLKPNLTLTGQMFSLKATLTPKPNENYHPRPAVRGEPVEDKCRADWGCGHWDSSIMMTLTRKRLFECHGFRVRQPTSRSMPYPSLTVINGSDTAGFHRLGHRDPTAAECRKVMGIRWPMRKEDAAEAIPPVYAKYICSNFMQDAACLEMLGGRL